MTEENKGSSAEELKEKIHFLTEENEHLYSKLGSTQSKAAQHAAFTRDLNSRLMQSEQDKLKISKQLVDMQIEVNKLREKYEGEIFELQNKVLCQEGVMANLEAGLSRLKQETESVSSRLQDAAEENEGLRRNFLCVSERLEREIKDSQELSDELLTLAHTHDTLVQEKEREHTHTLELERVNALLSRVTHSRVRRVEEELERMRKSYEDEHQRLEERIAAMGKEQQENKKALYNTQQDLAQQSASLLVSQHHLKEVEAENSKIQNQLKELNQEYRARLTHYIHDITECVSKEGEVSLQWKDYVDSMLKEVRVSYRSREEQLTATLRNYRKRLNNLSNTHQVLLIAYRMQRERILAHGDRGLEAGPPEAHFSPAETELRGETERELQRLRDDKSRLETQLRITQEQVSLLPQPSQNVALTEEAWTDIRKQLREITITAQEAHEGERTQLVTRATVAEEQVRELQEYVDNHLGRYKLEINRLRRILRLDARRSQSADLPKPRPLHQSDSKTSYEL